MNHDATHCFDYKKGRCPKSCYRAQLTEELGNILYVLPTSWAHFKGTKECPKLPGTNKNISTPPAGECMKIKEDKHYERNGR